MEAQFQDGKEQVVEAWYIDDSTVEDHRLPHHREPKQFVSLDKLAELGIVSWRLNADSYENDEDLKQIREARGYSHSYTFDLHPERFPNFETKLKSFYEEHKHAEDEATYCVDGSGYFDVRDPNDCWIRIAIKKGAMILLPSGIYHRFSLDTDNYIKVVMFFDADPTKRPKDAVIVRKEYFGTLMSKEIGSQGVEAL